MYWCDARLRGPRTDVGRRGSSLAMAPLALYPEWGIASWWSCLFAVRACVVRRVCARAGPPSARPHAAPTHAAGPLRAGPLPARPPLAATDGHRYADWRSCRLTLTSRLKSDSFEMRLTDRSPCPMDRDMPSNYIYNCSNCFFLICFW